jgi:hypothetical protein
LTRSPVGHQVRGTNEAAQPRAGVTDRAS